jgi:RNA polymerase sigma-70 factor (ECF subfamily)
MANHVRDVVESRSTDFVQLLTGIQSRLYAYVCTLVVDATGALDVLQETNVALWLNAHEYDPARPFAPWAYQVAYLQVLAYRKRCVRSRLVFDETLIREIADEFLLDDENHGVHLEALAHCMEKLPRPRRELLERRYRQGETVDQIASGLRKPPNVVSANLYRLRKALMACIQARLALD